MQKIVIINDIHGHLTALEAVLPFIKEINPDYIFTPGDIIGIGPHSNEVIDVLKALPNLYCTKGNHECYLLDGFYNPSSAFEVAHHQFIKKQVSEQNRAFLKSIPYEQHFEIEGFKICMLHYARLAQHFTPICYNPTGEALEELYKNIDADMIIYGHEHKPSIIKSPRLFINAGSLGCSNYNPGYAKMLLLTLDNKDYKIEEYFIPYDAAKVRDDITNIGLPDGEFINKTFIK